MERDAAVDRLEEIVAVVETDTLPVPVTEVWAYGDVALGLDPLEQLDVYLAKEVLLRGDAPERSDEFEDAYGVKGIGRTVRAAWVEAHPELLRAGDNGYAAPERCLAAHLLGDDEPVHLEVCNTGFEANVTQRLRGATARGAFEEVLDPRGVCLWVDGQRSPTAFEKLRAGEFVFPTLVDALEMLGASTEDARAAADALARRREEATGPSVRGDVG